MIYLDNAATTKVFDCAVKAAEQAMLDGYFNPNATYKSAVEAKTAMDDNRRKIASILGAKDGELIFTSCATESNNWVINCCRKKPNGNVVITAGEHASVFEPAMALKNHGIDVRVVPIKPSGEVDTDALAAAVDGDTTLVSVIHVSNETGAVNPIEKISAIVRARAPRALFHSDGVQAVLKTKPISSLGVDLYSISAHKLGAPKGIGALYIKKSVNISPLLYGGGQESGLRSGTQNTPYIAAFASALEQYSKLVDVAKTADIRDKLKEHFEKSGCTILGGNNSGFILTVLIPDVKAEILQNYVFEKGVIIGKGSACAGSKRGNRVLSAMGLDMRQSECCIRISLSVDTCIDDAMRAAQIITDGAEKIRSGNV